ncbi:unnamed protein product [Parnassius apollo]|uniref:(apollo) hypothetical protein n=1 Tax=Parnassius apollo TaxID=110799 RepID=A0A8S3YH98_PARAO|nr:unnamed protein product [Parnassius apollo]
MRAGVLARVRVAEPAQPARGVRAVARCSIVYVYLYVCRFVQVCGRAFVSLNRRNQHAVCAHTAPARRCPLCPALFHLRSMVNTHLKKVHLKAHKRRNRTSKHQNVFWRTETVPIQELSVSIQNEILELQAAQQDTINGTALQMGGSVGNEMNLFKILD